LLLGANFFSFIYGAAALFKRAVAAGYGEEELAALVKVVRGDISDKGGLTAKRTQNE
jgi:hypothetical protein